MNTTTRNDEELQPWQVCFRLGFAPSLPTAGLEALVLALKTDDPRLLQGATTQPPPLHCVQDWDVEGACLIPFAYWQGGLLKTVGDAEEAFARACYDCDQNLGTPAGCRELLNFWDSTPRDKARTEMLVEVRRELLRRPDRQD